MGNVRPAIETLRELDGAKFLDKLAIAIHDATESVAAFDKKATISITVTVAPFTKSKLAEPVITIEAEIVTKLPKPDAQQALFYIDDEGNPTTQQQRQRDLGLSIAGSAHQGAA